MSGIQIKKASRKKVKIKIGVQGSSGSGKTYSSLLLAKGLVGGDLSKVCMIDTENGSASLYSDLGEYSTVDLKAPFTPKKYAEALDAIIAAGFECVVMDSISHAWEYLLAKKDAMAGNSFTNWGKITPMQNKFFQKILQSDIHVISTMRSKESYVLQEKNGKFKPEKVGLKAVQRDGVGYEFTIVFDVNAKHNAEASKDRTGLFPIEDGEFQITEETGKSIYDWANTGATPEPSPVKFTEQRVLELISSATTIDKLKRISLKFKDEFPHIKDSLKQRATEIQNQ